MTLEDDPAPEDVAIGTHPRPQLARAGWRDLGGPWEFAFDDHDVGILEQWQDREDVFARVITVPFPFESPASGIGDSGYHPVVWYRRTVEAEPEAGHRLLLTFGAVDYRARVWVNGRLVASHEGGHTPFTADITPAMADGGVQVVVVRAEDDPHDLRQPRGKQDWRPAPHAIWYDRTSGIWQPVWLERVPAAAHIHALRWNPDVERRSLDLTARLRTDGRTGLRLRVRLHLDGSVLADDVYGVGYGVGTDAEVRRRITLAENDVSLDHSRLLWSPEHPTLIGATITLLDRDEEGDRPIDVVHSYTALRSLRASTGRLLLNDRPYVLRLVLAQNFWPASHLAAPSADALRREVELAKSLGFNGVRLHQKVEDPRFLAWCDRLGLLVWAELPSAFEFSDETVHRLTREWLQVVERDVSHPCIVAWVPLNESWGVPAVGRLPEQEHLVRALYHLTKSLDPDRLVVGNDGWEQPVGDLVTVHDYTSSGQVLRDRYGDRDAVEHTLETGRPAGRPLLLPGAPRTADAPVLVTEFGGVSLDLEADGDAWGGYGHVPDAEHLLAAYRDLVGALTDSPALAGFCWTQLTDTQQERNGLLTADRVPKLDVAAVHAVTTRGVTPPDPPAQLPARPGRGGDPPRR